MTARFTFLKGLFLLPLLLCTSLSSAEEDSTHLILYRLRQDDYPAAIDAYQEMVKTKGGHQVDLLRQIGLYILDLPPKTDEEMLLLLIGAAITEDPRFLPLYLKALSRPHPQLQLLAIDLLASLEDDRADEGLLRALSLPNILARFQSLHHLCHRRHPHAFTHLEALQVKLIPLLHPLFPPLYAMLHTPEADKALKRSLYDQNPYVRLATISSLADEGREDFVGPLRRLASHFDPRQQEAAASALGQLKDTESRERLHHLAAHQDPQVKLAALFSLHQLGEEERRGEIEALAEEKNLFAISLLGEMEGSAPFLKTLSSDELLMRLNVGLALLRQRDSAAFPLLKELFVEDSRNLKFAPLYSPGGSLLAIQLAPSPSRERPSELIHEVSRRLRESILLQTIELPEEDFLSFAQLLFQEKQIDLIPSLCLLLENLETEEAALLLERESERIGSPLVRAYANLSLFRMGRGPLFEERLIDWVTREQKSPLIEVRPRLSLAYQQENNSPFSLAPEDRSRLLIESIQAMAQRQDLMAIDLLLTLLKEGHRQNRYAAAGLLLRVIE